MKKQHRKRRVAVLVESTRAYARELIRGIALHNREHRDWEITFTPHGLGEGSSSWIKNWQGDGILARIDDRQTFRTIVKKNIPTVDLRRSFSSPAIPRIGPDDEAAVSMLFQFLRHRGFCRFAFVGVSHDVHPPMGVRRDCCRRLAETCDFFSELEMDVEPEENVAKNDRKLVRWLQRLPAHVAILACNDDFGLRVLNACQKIGRAVPDDLAVTGIGNDDCLCELAMPGLTSVDLNPYRIGYEAAEMLRKMMGENQVFPDSTLIEPKRIVARASTNILSTADEKVNTALRLIRDRACLGLDVREVLRHVRLSRVALENRFKKSIGRTIYQTILETRLERVQELLSNTDLTIKTIADRCGFEYPEYLMLLFRRRYGMTMNVFREENREV